jgi:carboxymethylenebutenolidase
MVEIAKRIASSGYVAVLPDLFYRVGSPFTLKPELPRDDAKPMFAIFGDDKLRGELMGRWMGPTLAYDHLRDTFDAVLGALEKHASIKGGFGTTGYCMGGNASLRLATIYGDRIRATASFHGGGLVTPQEDSPHHRLASVRSSVYVAGAIEDGSFTDEAKATLTDALAAAKVKHKVETYPGRHGFAVRDNPTYDEACAERHYAAMVSLFGDTLRA